MVARPPRPTGEPHLFRTTRPRRGRDGPGPCSWTQRPDGSGPRFHKSEGHAQQRGSSSSNSSGSREALTPPETQGSVAPHGGPQARARDPSGLASACERGRQASASSDFPPQLQPDGRGPPGGHHSEAVTFALWPRALQHHDRSLPLHKPSPSGPRPQEEASAPGRASARLAHRVARQRKPREQGRARGPEEKTSTKSEHSASQGSFP